MTKILVIGGGPGGYTAALHASQLGAEVILVEKDNFGGTCLNQGCIPTKSLLESSNIWHKSTSLFPEHVSGSVPWKSIFSRKNEAVLHLRKGVEGLLNSRNIKVIYGNASFIGKREVRVDGVDNQEIEADAIIIATGSRPSVPKIEGIQSDKVCTSDELLSMQTMPKKMAIIGGGVIGIEFATIFSELGLEVQVIEAADRILPNMDQDISLHLQKHLEKSGVTFHLKKKVQKITELDHDQVSLTVSEGKPIITDLILVAVGREAVVEPLNLDQIGVIKEGGKIKTDPFQQTTIEGVYAIGDCSSPMMLAHVAMAEGKVAAEHALGYETEPVIYDYVPQCIYSHPEAAMVGLTKDEAEKRGFQIKEGVFSLKASGRAIIEGGETGFIKVISDQQYGQILGVHLLCPNATEIISHATLSLTLESTLDELKSVIYPHPSIIEGILEAVL